MLATDIPMPYSIRASVMNRRGMWRYSKPRLSRNRRPHVEHLYLCLSSCSPRYHPSRTYFLFLHFGHLSSCSSTEIFLPRDASDDISSRCSTAAMCLHLHFFPVVWYAHSHMGLSSANHTQYRLPSVLWEATSQRFAPSVLI